MTDDDKVAQLFARNTYSGRSWYDTIDDPDEKAFIDAVVARSIEAGQLPNMAGTQRVLQEDFGDPVSTAAVRKHIMRATGLTR